jgi:putative SOS response-associated peptidase YedK
MCNLYSMTRNVEAIRRLFGISHNRAVAVEPLPAIFPGHVAPIVRETDGERELVTMSWGFVLLQPGRAPMRVTNTRDDKVQGSFWRQSFEQRRCLVPASAFAEPNGDVKPATWHWFALAGQEPRPLFAFAGLWRRYRGPVKKDGEIVEQEVFSFMTTTPNALVGSINHERMPVLLGDERAFATWLKGSPTEARTLLAEYPSERMRMVQAGYDKLDLLAL